MMLVWTALFWITATVIVLELHGTVQSVREDTAPAYLDVIKAHAALSDADRAAWLSFRSGEAEFAGPGVAFQDDITNASQEFQRLAALSGGPQLQTASGQLVNYQALVEQADAAYRADSVLETTSKRELGYAYLTYSSQSMRGPGGLLSSIGELGAADRRAVAGPLASAWADPGLMLVFELAGCSRAAEHPAESEVPEAEVPPPAQPAADAGRHAGVRSDGLGSAGDPASRRVVSRRRGHGAAEARRSLAKPDQRRGRPGGQAARASFRRAVRRPVRRPVGRRGLSERAVRSTPIWPRRRTPAACRSASPSWPS